MTEYYILKINNVEDAKNRDIFRFSFNRFMFQPKKEKITNQRIIDESDIASFCVLIECSTNEFSTIETLRGNILGKIQLSDKELKNFINGYINIFDIDNQEFINTFEYVTRHLAGLA